MLPPHLTGEETEVPAETWLAQSWPEEGSAGILAPCLPSGTQLRLTPNLSVPGRLGPPGRLTSLSPSLQDTRPGISVMVVEGVFPAVTVFHCG